MIVCCNALHHTVTLAASAWHGRRARLWCGAVWTACGRLAGVQQCESVQHEHRRLEHRVGDDAVLGISAPSAVAHIAAAQPKCGRGSSPAQAVAAQMWAAPWVAVGQSRRRFGRVGSEPSPGADVGEFLVQKWAKSRRRCGSTKHLLLHENMLQRAARACGVGMARLSQSALVRCGVDRVWSARRRFTMRRRSTPTSAAGTPRR
jgi:hypothetical protein